MEVNSISSYKTKSDSSNYSITNLDDEPLILGPDRLCNVFGSIIGTFSGGGNPSTDVYRWKITGPSGEELFAREGGFQTISFTFSLIGEHKISLEIFRGGISIGSEVKTVPVILGPEVTLDQNYLLCENQELLLTAISPESPGFDDYQFEWRDEGGTIIGTENNLTITELGPYEVSFFFENEDGIIECSTILKTEISGVNEFSISSDKNEICPSELITFTSSPLTVGNWFYQLEGQSERVFFAKEDEIIINPIATLDGPGNYTIFFEVPNENNQACAAEVSTTITFNPEPDIEFVSAESANGCQGEDGTISIRALTPIDVLSVEGLGITFTEIKKDEIITVPGLKSGAYTMVGSLGNCSNSIASVVPLENPPDQLEFEIIEIIGEECTANGKKDGSFTVSLINGGIDGGYRLFNERGGIVFNNTLPDGDQFTIELPGGTYYLELYDQSLCNLPQAEEIKVPALEDVNFFVPSVLNICQSFELTPITNQDLEFTLTFPDGTTQKSTSTSPFILTQDGIYSITGAIPNQSQICPITTDFEVFLVDPVDFEPILREEDCFGNRTYEADIKGRDPSTVNFYWFNENDELIGTGQFLNPVSYGTFKLDVQPSNSSSCPNPPVEFEIEEPVLSVDATLTSTKLCEFGPEAIVNLETTFPEAVTDVRWRRFDEGGEIIELPEFDDSWEITTRIGGTYEASVYSIIPAINKNCELGRSSIQLNLVPDKVLFDIPSEISVCQSFSLIPDTNDELDFFVTSPSGDVLQGVSGDSFTLDQEGTYIFLAFDQDSPTHYCPEQKEVMVTMVEPVIFEPILSEAFCDGGRIYQAKLGNYNPNEVFFIWRNSNGDIIGEEEFLTLPSAGNYSLEVQPNNSQTCPYPPIEFTETPPVFEVDVTLDPNPLCPDADSAIITLLTDLDQVTSIEWWFTDLSGNQIQLTNFNNQTEILAIEEGTYEVRAFNFIRCLVGTDQVIILRSQDDVRPIVEESYQICPRYEIGPNIDPGDFASYEWYFEGQLVSENSVFKPLQVGNYQLIVYSLEGCAYETTFSTTEECELKVKFPTALMPNDPEKPFLIYTNYLVDELELWIFNQWGELIFHCKNTDLINEESTCVWDGTFNGEKVPNGAYSLRVNYRNIEKNINEEYLGSIMVIE